MSNCWTKQIKESKALNQNKPQWLISSNRGVSCRISIIEDVIEEYRPFLSGGYVSIKGFNYKNYGSERYGIRSYKVPNNEEFPTASIKFGHDEFFPI